MMNDQLTLPGGIHTPRMGLGTWAWGDTATWKYDAASGFAAIRGAYRTSVDAGVTLLDTAEMYGDGESERIIGRLLAEDPHRDRVIVASKFMPFPWRFFVGSALMSSLRASLERLQLKSIHLYQIHGPISVRSHAAMADALAEPFHAGLIKTVGVSNYSEREMRALHGELQKRNVPLATNQVEYSLLRRFPETSGLLGVCKELGVTLLAYSPLAMGRLTGKYSASSPPPGGRRFSAFPMAEVDPIIAEMRRIGARHGDRTPAQVALNWLMCKGAVPIPGAKNSEQAAQNAGALGWRLEDDDVAVLDQVSKPGQRGLFNRIWQHG